MVGCDVLDGSVLLRNSASAGSVATDERRESAAVISEAAGEEAEGGGMCGARVLISVCSDFGCILIAYPIGRAPMRSIIVVLVQ